MTVSTETIADGLDHPWGLAFLPDGALLVTERGGTIRIVKDGKVSKPVANVPKVVVKGEGGLLDVALAPDFAKSGNIYFSYAEPRQDGTGTVMARARLVRNGDGAELENVSVLLSVKQSTKSSAHFGSRILVAPDGK
ncbi:MAG TPA: PQQ-dependent sugar dehydrogenase, partial [Phyllobacterium sp.]|nr:PQQ-dependent sugar dehydrogenase [Phyllobacterium sp.]